MGDIIYPVDEWSKREIDLEKNGIPKPGVPERPKRFVVSRNYLGVGHWIFHFSDGTKELKRIDEKIAPIFYKTEEYTDDGHPLYSD